MSVYKQLPVRVIRAKVLTAVPFLQNMEYTAVDNVVPVTVISHPTKSKWDQLLYI